VINIKFILAWEDGTWTTKVKECPSSFFSLTGEELVQWWMENAGVEYRKVVYVGVFNRQSEVREHPIPNGHRGSQAVE